MLNSPILPIGRQFLDFLIPIFKSGNLTTFVEMTNDLEMTIVFSPFRKLAPKSKRTMKKVFHLASCSTCVRIIKELGGLEDFEHQNIKEKNISAEELDWIKEKVGSYEALFSRRAMKYRQWGLNEKELTEADYRKYMLEEYTFLKRPFIVDGEEVFIGNTKKVVEAAKTHMGL